MGTFNDGYINYPNSKSSSSLVSPYSQSRNLELLDKNASVESSNDGSEVFEEETIETYHVNDTYTNIRYHPNRIPSCKPKTNTKTDPEYEDLASYNEKPTNVKPKDRVYSLPDVHTGPEQKRFNRMYSLPENITPYKAQNQNHNCVQSSVYTLPGIKKQNILYEKTQVIKTNSLTTCNTTSKRMNNNRSKRSSITMNQCFCALNVIFGCCAIAALIIGVVLIVKQEGVEKTELTNNVNIIQSSKSIEKAVNSLNSITEKLTKINSNMGDMNSTLQKMVTEIHHVLELQKKLNSTLLNTKGCTHHNSTSSKKVSNNHDSTTLSITTTPSANTRETIIGATCTGTAISTALRKMSQKKYRCDCIGTSKSFQYMVCEINFWICPK